MNDTEHYGFKHIDRKHKTKLRGTQYKKKDKVALN